MSSSGLGRSVENRASLRHKSVCQIPLSGDHLAFQTSNHSFNTLCRAMSLRDWAKRCQKSARFSRGAEDSLYSMLMEKSARSTHMVRRGFFSPKCPLSQTPDPPKLRATTSIIPKHLDSQSKTSASRRRTELLVFRGGVYRTRSRFHVT